MRMMAMKSCVALLLLFLSTLSQADTVADLLQKGDELQQAGNMEQAQQMFEQAVRAAPASALAQNKLAGAYLVRQAYAKSIAHYQAAIPLQQAEPAEQAKSFLGLGLAYLHSEQNPLAFAAFQEAQKLAPHYQAQLAPLLKKLQE